jgi:hypothetical protein
MASAILAGMNGSHGSFQIVTIIFIPLQLNVTHALLALAGSGHRGAHRGAVAHDWPPNSWTLSEPFLPVFSCTHGPRLQEQTLLRMNACTELTAKLNFES